MSIHAMALDRKAGPPLRSILKHNASTAGAPAVALRTAHVGSGDVPAMAPPGKLPVSPYWDGSAPTVAPPGHGGAPTPVASSHAGTGVMVVNPYCDDKGARTWEEGTTSGGGGGLSRAPTPLMENVAGGSGPPTAPALGIKPVAHTHSRGSGTDTGPRSPFAAAPASVHVPTASTRALLSPAGGGGTRGTPGRAPTTASTAPRGGATTALASGGGVLCIAPVAIPGHPTVSGGVATISPAQRRQARARGGPGSCDADDATGGRITAAVLPAVPRGGGGRAARLATTHPDHGGDAGHGATATSRRARSKPRSSSRSRLRVATAAIIAASRLAPGHMRGGTGGGDSDATLVVTSDEDGDGGYRGDVSPPRNGHTATGRMRTPSPAPMAQPVARVMAGPPVPPAMARSPVSAPSCPPVMATPAIHTGAYGAGMGHGSPHGSGDVSTDSDDDNDDDNGSGMYDDFTDSAAPPPASTRTPAPSPMPTGMRLCDAPPHPVAALPPAVASPSSALRHRGGGRGREVVQEGGGESGWPGAPGASQWVAPSSQPSRVHGGRVGDAVSPAMRDGGYRGARRSPPVMPAMPPLVSPEGGSRVDGVSRWHGPPHPAVGVVDHGGERHDLLVGMHESNEGADLEWGRGRYSGESSARLPDYDDEYGESVSVGPRDTGRHSVASATSTTAVRNAPLGRTPLNLAAAGLVLGSGMRSEGASTHRLIARNLASDAPGACTPPTASRGAGATMGTGAASIASPTVGGGATTAPNSPPAPRPVVATSPPATAVASLPVPLKPAGGVGAPTPSTVLAACQEKDAAVEMMAALGSRRGADAYRPSTALNEDDYHYAVVVVVDVRHALRLYHGVMSPRPGGDALLTSPTPRIHAMLRSHSSEADAGMAALPTRRGPGAGLPDRCAGGDGTLMPAVPAPSPPSSVPSSATREGGHPPPPLTGVGEGHAGGTATRPLLRRVTWSQLPTGPGEVEGGDATSGGRPAVATPHRASTSTGVGAAAEEVESEGEGEGGGVVVAATDHVTLTVLASPSHMRRREEVDSACEYVYDRIKDAVKSAGLTARWVRSLSRHTRIIKLKASEERLEEEAERIRLRLRRRDGGWSRFKRSMRDAFVPTYHAMEAEETGLVGVDEDDAGAGGVSLFHSSDRQILIDHILRSSAREHGADLGQGGALSVHINKMFPLHMEARLHELANDWLVVWRPEQSHGGADRMGLVDPALYAESRLVPIHTAAVGVGSRGVWSSLLGGRGGTRGVDEDGEAAVTPSQLPGFQARLAAAAGGGSNGGGAGDGRGGGQPSATAGGTAPAGGRKRGHDDSGRCGGECDEVSCCCCAVACLRCTSRAAAWRRRANDPCGAGLCGFLRALAVLLLVFGTGVCKARRSTSRCFSRLLSQPLDRIAAYYGETIAFYFAWLEFYTQWLVLPAGAGVLLFGGQLYYGTLDIAYVPLFSLFMAIWSITFLTVWKRRNAVLAQRWGVLNYEDEEVVRPQFAGTWQQDTTTGSVVRVFPRWKRALRYCVTAPIVLLFVSAMVLLMIFLFATRDQLFAQLARRDAALAAASNGTVVDMSLYSVDLRQSVMDAWSSGIVGFFKGEAMADATFPGLTEPSTPSSGGTDRLSWRALRDRLSRFESYFSTAHDWRWWLAMTMPPIIYGVLMPIFDWIFGKLALRFNDWENHATESSYRNHRIAKVFFYRFVTSFVSLFYYAFSPQHSLLTLFIQLAAFLIVGQMLNNVIELVSASLCQKCTGCRAARRLAQAEESGLTEGAYGHRLLRHAQSKAWVQARMPVYDTFNDYAELLIQFGYVTFFSWAFPLAPLCALANNVIEMRTDALRLVKLTQRPIAHKAGGIGVWYNVLVSMSFLAVLTNCAHLALTSRQFRVYFPNLSDAERLLVVFVIEHLVMASYILLTFLIPPIPAAVRRRAMREARNLARLQGRQSVGEGVFTMTGVRGGSLGYAGSGVGGDQDEDEEEEGGGEDGDASSLSRGTKVAGSECASHDGASRAASAAAVAP